MLDKTVINDIQRSTNREEEEKPFQFPYSIIDDDYVDLSQKMIDQMNRGDFDTNVTDENVSITSFS